MDRRNFVLAAAGTGILCSIVAGRSQQRVPR
jgi:hypothetical protein